MDAHGNEYAAAVAGMADTYGHALAVGDFVNGLSGDKHWSGRVVEVVGDRVVIDCDGATITAPLSDLTAR